jgi:hypothetical protein
MHLHPSYTTLVQVTITLGSDARLVGDGTVASGTVTPYYSANGDQPTADRIAVDGDLLTLYNSDRLFSDGTISFTAVHVGQKGDTNILDSSVNGRLIQ